MIEKGTFEVNVKMSRVVSLCANDGAIVYSTGSKKIRELIQKHDNEWFLVSYVPGNIIKLIEHSGKEWSGRWELLGHKHTLEMKNQRGDRVAS